MLRIVTTAVSCLLGLGALAPDMANAQSGTQTPLRLVVPFPAGGGTDILGRFIANELQPIINQPVIVVNQTGASGYIGSHAVHTAAPDGNTLLLATTNHAIFPGTKKELSFDVVDGFESVTQICEGPLVIAARPDVPYKTLPAMLEYAKANPGKLSYGSSGGVGNVTHLSMDLLGQMAKVQFLHVPYRGAAPAIADTLAGVVPMTMSTLVSATQYFDSKLLIPIAQSSKKRGKVAPNIPTVAELTGLDYDLTYWIGILAPPKTPADRVEFLRKSLTQAVTSPKAVAYLQSQGFDPKTGTGEDFKTFMRAEVKLWTDVAQAAKIEKE